jgi:hypothetical protein
VVGVYPMRIARYVVEANGDRAPAAGPPTPRPHGLPVFRSQDQGVGNGHVATTDAAETAFGSAERGVNLG